MKPKNPQARRAHIAVSFVFALVAALLAPYARSQSVTLAGLRSTAGKSSAHALRTDAAGNIFLLTDQNDGVRIFKLNPAADAVLAQTTLGSTGDSGLALALDPSGNVYVTGTSYANGSLTGTAGTAYPNRADSSANSFVAKLSNTLITQWVTFLGAGRTASSAIATNGTTVVVTGSTYTTTFPVTSNGIQQAPAPASSGNGFVTALNTASGTVAFSTYLTGANGDTSPLAIAEDSAGNTYIAGSTTATGFPTVNALIPRILVTQTGGSSGFLTALSPAGNQFLFSTFIPGDGIQSIALDSASTGLLLSGNIDSGRFPISAAPAPLAATKYQAVVRIPLDGQSVTFGSIALPGTSSAVAAGPEGTAWLSSNLTSYLLPLTPAQETGLAATAHITTAGDVDAIARHGGIASTNTGTALLRVTPAAVALSGNAALSAFTLTPTLSSTDLATQRFDLPLVNAPNPAFPSTVRDTLLTSCNGQCQGTSAIVTKFDAAGTGPQLALSTDNSPNIVLRNLGHTSAQNLTITQTGFTSFATSCGSTLPVGSVCNIALIGTGPGSITVLSSNGSSATASLPASAVAPDTIVVSPRELDFGIVSAASLPSERTFTITNLSASPQTFTSALQSVGTHAWSVTEAGTDCTPTQSAGTKLLAAGASCRITLAFAASASSTEAAVEVPWLINGSELQLTAFTQATALNVSTHTIDFGRRFTNGPRTARFLYISNNSTTAQSHGRVTLPATSPFSAVDGCPATLAAHSVCRIQFDYLSPNAPSADATTLTLDDGSALLLQGESVLPPTVNGSIANPGLSVSPSAIAFTSTTAATTVSAETRTVTISNIGATAFPLSLAITADFAYSTNCPTTLAGGASCTAQLTFTPASGGTRQGLLAVTAGNFSPTYVDLSGNATAILPGNLALAAFGDVPVGVPSVQWIKIAQPYTALTASSSNPDFTLITVEDTGFGHGSPARTAFKQQISGPCLNCWLGIQFTPTSNGSESASITLQSVSGGTPYLLQATGTGLPLTGVLLTPTSYDFGPVLTGSWSAPQVFTLTNATSSEVTVGAPATTGDFNLTSAATGSPCSTTLAAGTSCLISVRFQPTVAGLRTGSLTVATSANGSLSSTFSGFGAPSDGVAFRPGSLRFDNVPGTESRQQTITVVNSGSDTITIGAPTHTAANFAIASNCTTLAPAATCTLVVTFTPGPARVADTVNLPVTFAVGSGAPVTYALPVTGDYTSEDVGLQIVPEQINFGSAATSTAGPVRVFRVNNLSTHPLTIAATAPRQFALTQNNCAGLAPNASCTVAVQFVPVTQGDITGTLFLTGTPTDGAPTVTALGFLEGYGAATNALNVTGVPATNTLSFGLLPSGQQATRNVTITNTNATPITVRRVTSAPPFLSTTTCGAALSLNQSCTVTITYSATFQTSDPTATPRTDNGSIILEADSANSPLILDLTGQVTPQITGSPTASAPLYALTTSQGTLAFAATSTGDQSAQQSVNVTNTGTETINISGISTTTDFTATSSCATLLPGAACSIQVRFTPQASGPRVSSLQIGSNSSTALESVTLFGTATPGNVTLSATTLDFGSVLTGATSPAKSVTVTNSGTTPITFTGTAVSGEFNLSGGTCPAPGGTLASGASCTTAVTFSPLGSGARRGTLSIATSATTLPLQVALTGTGVTPQLTATPASLNFGNVPVGQTASLSFTLANPGATDITGLAFTTSNSAFAATSTCGLTTIRAGATCSVTVRFAPTSIGTQTGTVSIASSDPASPLVVSLTGSGTQGGNFTLTINGSNAATATVVQGLPATFALSLTPTQGFAGPVAITCSPQQQVSYVFCSANPAVVTLGTGTQTSALTVTTVSAQAALRPAPAPWEPRTALAALASLVPLGFVAWRRRKLSALLAAALLTLAALGSTGCGSKNNADTRIRYATPGTYTFTVTASSTTGIPISQTVTATVTIQQK